MAQYLSNLCEQLLTIRKYLIKKGPSGRKEHVVTKKYNEANVLRDQYNVYLDSISKVLHLKSESEKLLIHKYCSEFKQIFEEIKTLCLITKSEISREQQETSDEAEESVSDSNLSNYETSTKMEKFDLKVALSLLPLMTDKEENTKELIDGIEYYGSILDDTSKSKLIQFIIKTRLSQSAKLKLANEYSSIDDLLKDMRKQLLPQKSATAIQTKLQNLRQNERSVVDFGKEISELFVDLTISQADGNKEHYNILRPLNEKLAIKRFSDGLRNRRLSTIIAARDFKTLKDAVQAAQEEEMTSTCTGSTEVVGTYQHRQTNQNYRRPQRGYRGQIRPHRASWVRTNYVPRYMNNPRTFSRGRSTRGRFTGNQRARGRNIHFMTQQSDMSTENEHDATQQPNTDTLNHFFRS